MSSDRERSPGPRRPAPLQRRLLQFAAAVLAPLVVGALACGLLLLLSSTRSHRLAEEMVEESSVSVSLSQGLQAARIAGSAYMEDGKRLDLVAFRAAARHVDQELAKPVFDEDAERTRVRRLNRQWENAVGLLEATPTGISPATDDAVDPEDAFEAQLNDAIGGVARLVDNSQREIRRDLAATDRLNRSQGLIALVALLTSLGIAALLARRLAAAALRPIHRLTHAARALGSGHLGHRVQVTSSAELHEMAATFNGMSEALQQQHDQLERQAFTDSLTGIPNRALFEDRARHALERGLRADERIAMLMIDLDDFKLVNDGLGHSCGDELISLAAGRIDEATRAADTVARLGGDEFAVLIESVHGLDDALGAAERIRRSFAAPFVWADRRSWSARASASPWRPSRWTPRSSCGVRTSPCTA